MGPRAAAEETKERGAGEAEEEASGRMSRREILKLLAVIGFVVVVVVLAQEVGLLLTRIRDWLVKQPLSYCLPVFVVVMVVRRVVVPIWYTVPTGVLMIIYLVFKVGVVRAAVIFQTLKLLDFVSFLILQRWFGPYFCDEDEEGQQMARSAKRCLPQILLDVVYALDREWGGHLRSQAPVGKTLTFIAFGATWFLEEEAMLFWFAVRSHVPNHLICIGLVTFTYLNTFDTIIRAQAVKGALDALSGSSAEILWEAIAQAKWYFVFLALLIATPATIYIHGRHVRLVYRKCTTMRVIVDEEADVANQDKDGENDTSLLQSPRRDHGDFAHQNDQDRERRRRELLQQQVTSIQTEPT